MVGGRGSPDQADARLWAYRDAAGFARLIELLVEVSVTYLDAQIRAGAAFTSISTTGVHLKCETWGCSRGMPSFQTMTGSR